MILTGITNDAAKTAVAQTIGKDSNTRQRLEDPAIRTVKTPDNLYVA